MATRVAGRPTVGRALAWAHVVHAATLWWFDEYVLPELLQDGQPRPLLPGLEALLGDPFRQRQLMRAVSSGLPTGDGAVPGLADRVYGLQTGAEVPDLLPGAAAAELLQAPSTVLDLVAEASLGHPSDPAPGRRRWTPGRPAPATAVPRSSPSTPTTSARSSTASRTSGWPAGSRDAVRDADVDADELGCFLLTGLLAARWSTPVPAGCPPAGRA